MKRLLRICFVFSFLFVVKCSAFAQYFNSGQDPAAIRWKQINAKEFQIIFPEAFENKAKYMAAIFQDLLEKGGKNLNHKPKKFSVVLHTHSATSNGLVAWAPKRMEIYTTSPQDNDAQLWIDHVSTHEYRHVIQLDKLEQGFTRLMNHVFGQQATAVVVGLYLPPWFLEGDAVCIETSTSESGRGRLPVFIQELRAQLLEKGVFSYDKAVNGSYVDFVTDRYKLGYHMVGKGRTNYGDQLWENTLNRVGRKPLGITSFAKGIELGMQTRRDAVFEALSNRQKEILAQGIKVEEIDWEQVKKQNIRSDGKLMLYYDVMKEMQWEWQVQDARLEPTEFTALSSREDYYTNRRYPHVTESGETIVYKQGLADAGYFEITDEDGKSGKLFVPGFNFNSSFDYKNEKLIWSERKAHVRWEKADKSVLVSYDVKSGNRRKYKSKNSWFAPSFSSDGNRIAAIEVDKAGKNALVIIDEESGDVKQRFVAKEYEYFLTPQWQEDDQAIVMMVVNPEGKQLISLNLRTGDKRTLVQSGKYEMSQPEVGTGRIFFTAAFTGIDNIYAYDQSNRKVYQVTSSRFGARDPHLNKNNQLYYSDYTSDGYIPVRASLNKNDWKEWQGVFEAFPLAKELSDQLGEKLNPDTTNLDRFQVKNYSKLGHLFNFHSWAPVFIDGLEQEADIGISVATQNKLSTLMATVGYKREEGFENGQFYANLSYRGWFPIFDSKLTVGDREVQFATLADRIAPPQVDTILVRRTWKQWGWENSISLPFDLSGGQYNTQIIPKVTYNLIKLANRETVPLGIFTSNPNLGLGQYNIVDQDITQEIMEYQLFAFNIAKTAPRDVQFRWAQILEFNYLHTPLGDTELGNTWSAEGHFYVPGFYKHHGIKLYGGYQKRSRFNSLFSNIIKSPRGMSDLFGEDIVTTGVDYALPLFYPDWNIGPLAYFKRVKMSGFFDYGYQKGKVEGENDNLFEFKEDFMSFGAEFRSDLHVLRFPAPVDFGFRVGYENRSKSMFASFLISFSLASY